MLKDEWTKLRKEKGLGRIQVAKDSGLTPSMVGKFERGICTISIINFDKILKTVGCKLKIEKLDT